MFLFILKHFFKITSKFIKSIVCGLEHSGLCFNHSGVSSTTLVLGLNTALVKCVLQYIHTCTNCVLQALAEELGSFAHVTTLQSNFSNIISVIQAAYNVRFNLYMTSELQNTLCNTHVHLGKILHKCKVWIWTKIADYTVHNELSEGVSEGSLALFYCP